MRPWALSLLVPRSGFAAVRTGRRLASAAETYGEVDAGVPSEERPRTRACPDYSVFEPLTRRPVSDLADHAEIPKDHGACPSQRLADDLRYATAGRLDAPRWMDFEPAVAAVKHPRSDDAQVGTDLGSGDVAP